MMFGLLPSLKAKKKRPHEDHSHPKRSKIDGPNPTKNPIQFETTLSPPIQEALCKFREASEQELLRLRKEGMDPSTAINKLVEKMRTVESNEDPQPRFTRQELELVMEIAGVNEEGATRALILRSELAKLRHDGFNHPEAINELSRRMKRLAGSKRRGSSSVDKGIEGKHRRREKDTNHTHNTNTTTTTTTTTSTTPPTSRVSFNSFDPLDDFDFLIPPGTRYIPIPTSTTTTLTPTPTSAATATPDTQTPLSTLSINRKRLQDALMLDGGRYGLLRKRQKYDKDISESDSDNENENESESEGDHYAFFDEGEFSHDDDEKLDEEDDGEDDIFPPIGSLHHHYSSSSSEGEGEERGMEDEGEGEWQSHLLFNEIKEEESDSDDRAWRLAPPSITSPISPSRSHSSTTTTTTTTTTSSSSPSSSYLFSSSTPSPPPTPPHAHSRSSSSSTRTNATRTTKRRDTTTPSSSSSSSSSRVLSHRTKS